MTTQLAPALRPACRAPGVDPEAFFPLVASTEQLRTAADTARRYCGSCPLLDACRREGAGQPIGIWGGRLHLDDGHTVIDLLKPLPTTLKKAKRS